MGIIASTACDINGYIIKPDNVLALEEFTFSTFHTVTLCLFLLAIVHTLYASKINHYARKIERRHKERFAKGEAKQEHSFLGEILFFLGEVEVIFGLWAVPLVIVISYFYSWKTAIDYISTRNYTEALFVIVMMSLVSTRPIVYLGEQILKSFASLFKGGIRAWWFSLLTVGPLLGSLITEVGAMTLCAMLLSRLFYVYRPSAKLSYATLGLLFTNISVGGMLTNFAAPPVLIIARCWEWSSLDMFLLFGVKAIIGVFITTIFYLLLFQKEFKAMEKKSEKPTSYMRKDLAVPFWILAGHIFFIFWVVFHAHYSPIFIGSYLLFLGFYQATKPFQFQNSIRQPILVGFFLAGLIIHGGLQGWWITPLLQSLHHRAIMPLGLILTAINDNAAITYLTSLVPNWSEINKYAIISGVMTGGGLTVIANAPNPAGFVILNKHFSKGISPVYLLLGALVPCIIFFLLFYYRLMIE